MVGGDYLDAGLSTEKRKLWPFGSQGKRSSCSTIFLLDFTSIRGQRIANSNVTSSDKVFRFMEQEIHRLRL